MNISNLTRPKKQAQKKLVIVTDAAKPQVNGVVTTLNRLASELKLRDWQVLFITPNLECFQTIATPSYPEIRLVINPWAMTKAIREYKPDYIHVATEGPLGWFATMWAFKNRFPFTTSYHTNFPTYLKTSFYIPKMITYFVLKLFHNRARRTLVTTEAVKQDLINHGFRRDLVVWTRGVDCSLFHNSRRTRPVNPSNKRLLYVGRVSNEKNLDAFLDLNIENTHKVVVGDGPILDKLKAKYTNVLFVGIKKGVALAKEYADADVFVFPSLSDTFGLVQIESMSSGVPVAAFSGTDSASVISNGITGYTEKDLTIAIKKCYNLDLQMVRAHCLSKYSWETCANIFEETILMDSVQC